MPDLNQYESVYFLKEGGWVGRVKGWELFKKMIPGVVYPVSINNNHHLCNMILSVYLKALVSSRVKHSCIE